MEIMINKLTIDIIKQEVEMGLLIFDKNYHIICFNKFIKDIFQINKIDTSLLNLAQLHSKEAFLKIKEMVELAKQNTQNSTSIIKIYKPYKSADLILMAKILLLYGQKNLFIALLYDITNILTNAENAIIKLPVYDKDNFLLLTLDNIEYFKAKGNYTEVFYENRIHLSPLRLGEIEKRLVKNQFLRCHKSFIVNLKYIKNLKRIDNKYIIVTESQQQIPISRNRIKPLLHIIGLR